MDLSDLASYLSAQGEPSFRFRQIAQAYFSGRYTSFSELTNLSLSLRHDLQAHFPFLSVKPLKLLHSSQAQKALLALDDGLQIESVLMNYEGWSTVCLSTQVGCPLNCAFCATGKMGFKRNLTSAEIIDQIIYWKKDSIINRVVFMGMGEPFLNWDNFLTALKTVNSPSGLNIGARKISVSTAGIPNRIIDFANLGTEVNLALSLHSAIDSTRSSLMPVNRQYPLTTVMEAIAFYVAHTRRQVFFEYAPIKGINDTPAELSALINLLSQNRLYFLNLISLNPTDGNFQPSASIDSFRRSLDSHHLNYSFRHSLGQEINSACGQLITKTKI